MGQAGGSILQSHSGSPAIPTRPSLLSATPGVTEYGLTPFAEQLMPFLRIFLRNSQHPFPYLNTKK